MAMRGGCTSAAFEFSRGVMGSRSRTEQQNTDQAASVSKRGISSQRKGRKVSWAATWNRKETENTRRQMPISIFEKSTDPRGRLGSERVNEGWQCKARHAILRLWNFSWLSSGGDRTGRAQAVLAECFPLPRWSAAAPETQISDR